MRHRFVIGVVATALIAAATGGCGGDNDSAKADGRGSDSSRAGGSGTGGSGQANGGGGGPSVGLVDLKLDLDSPIAMTTLPGSNSLLFAERSGRIREATRDGDDVRLVDGAVLDITKRVGNTDGERGLLGIAVDPDGDSIYASYTRSKDGASQLDRYNLTGDEGDLRADPDSRKPLLTVAQPFSNHNGGNIVFGPDKMLYLGLGDGGGSGDPNDNAQDQSSLLGKILRLDADAKGSIIPADNPFADGDGGARPEIWLSGVRNPWRFSFDRATGDLWIGDVGQNKFEEIDFLPESEGAGRGVNLGWNRYEGTEPFNRDSKTNGSDFVEPLFTYSHDEGCSVTGGVVYRGDDIPTLKNTYLFADFCADGIRALKAKEPVPNPGDVDEFDLLSEPSGIVSFGEDQDNEVYVLSLDGGVYRLVEG